MGDICVSVEHNRISLKLSIFNRLTLIMLSPQLFKRWIYSRTLAICSFLVLAGCSAPMPDLDLKPQIDGLFVALSENDYEKVMTYYSDDFFKAFPREYWRQRLEKFNQHMGTMEGYRIRSKQADTRYSGKFFVYQLETVHEGDKKAKHIVTFVLPVDGSDVKMVGHKITAKGFQ